MFRPTPVPDITRIPPGSTPLPKNSACGCSELRSLGHFPRTPAPAVEHPEGRTARAWNTGSRQCGNQFSPERDSSCESGYHAAVFRGCQFRADLFLFSCWRCHGCLSVRTTHRSRVRTRSLRKVLQPRRPFLRPSRSPLENWRNPCGPVWWRFTLRAARARSRGLVRGL